MVFPSADLSPNLANASNCSFKAALSTGELEHKGAFSTDLMRCQFSNHVSGEFSATQAQGKVVKIKKILMFPTGLEVHLEDMF